MSFAVRLIAAASFLAASLVFPAQAREAARPACPPESAPAAPHLPRGIGLPDDSTTQHCLALPGRTLNFSAVAGTIKLVDDKNAEQAEVAYIAYQLDATKASERPVTFVFNGGPGASSAWLNLGALGPWRLPLAGGALAPSSPPTLIDNSETWLDFTDLVFIDPPGTGYSRITAAGEEARKSFWTVNGDIDALSAVVRRWLAANGRLASPKFIAGESYGGFRGPRLAKALATKQGVGINGLALISPALDMGMVSGADATLAYAILLPSFAAAARERTGRVTRESQADVETYASGEYLADFLRGPRDAAAVARMVERVSALTGLAPALVRQLGGRIDKRTFQREFDRAHGRIGAVYDPTISAADPDPSAPNGRWLDPILDGNLAPLASAMVELYAHRLGWMIENVYEPLNSSVNRNWDWGRSLNPPDSLGELSEMLALDPNFHALVAQGFNDLAVPYYGTKLLLDQLPDTGGADRVTFRVYGGGHMFYSRDDSRKALREEARRLIERG